MKISIFTTCSNPIKRQDPFHEALNSYDDLADEIVVVNGSPEFDLWGTNKFISVNYAWPEKFKWTFIGQQFQRGYEACTGDWVIHCDLDYIFHEDDIKRIRQILENNPFVPAMSFYKYQFLLVDRFNLKSRVVIAVNKKHFGDRIRFDAGGDLCQPSLDGNEIKPSDCMQADIPFYNYDFCFKELPVIEKDWIRFRRAYKECFDRDFGDFKSMMVGRFNNRSWKQIKIEEHPKYIRDKIKNITPDKFGHSMFGWIKEVAYGDKG